MKSLLPILLFWLACWTSLNAQPPDPSQADPMGHQPEFQVRVSSFDGSDSVHLLFHTPDEQELVRLVTEEVSVMGGRGGLTEAFEQFSLLRENGDRIDLPRGELFFSFDGNWLYTEAIQQNQQGNLRLLSLRKYRVYGKRTRLQATFRDTLRQRYSPRWHYCDGQYVISPRAKDIFYRDSSFFIVRKGESPREVLLWHLNGRALKADLSQQVRLGSRAFDPNRQPTSFGIREVFATPAHRMVHSVYQVPGKPLGHLFSAFDAEGNMLWERTRGEAMLTRTYPQEEFFLLSNEPLIYQKLSCLDAQSGQSRWETSLYDLYNNDPLFEYDVVKPEEIETVEMAPVLGGQYLGVVMARKKEQRHEQAVLYLFNRLGKMVYRYPLEHSARLLGMRSTHRGWVILTDQNMYVAREK
jgi:hypothetical protein